MNLAIQGFSYANLHTKNGLKQQKAVQSPIANENFAPRVTRLVDTNYGASLVNKNAISFKGVEPDNAVSTEVIPLSTRIGGALANMGKDDAVIVAPSLESAKKDFQESADEVQSVVKKVNLIVDPSIIGSFLLKKNDIDLYDILNMSKSNMMIESGEQKFLLHPKKTALVMEHDTYKLGGTKFQVEPDFNLLTKDLPKLGVETYDFSKKDLTAIKKLNLKHMEELGYQATETGTKKKLTFSDVGGQDAALTELKKSVVYPLKFPSAYKNNIINRGIILTGGPGTGKTLMAEALANETDAHFIKLNGLEMESKWVGQTEENWRALFDEAKDNQPSIVFIDEFDAVAKNREGSDTSRHDDKTVNQLLTLMSDLEKGKDDVFVIVATNKIDLLDPAIKRSGRFGKHIQVGAPDLAGCKKILDIHTKELPIEDGFDKDAFANKLKSANATGADIAKIANDANSLMYERTGVYEKMENGTFEDKDVEQLKILPQDFDKALTEFEEQKKVEDGDVKKHNPIGFLADIH
ncbi:MAG: ATP-binding protein [Candidatus Gastranaerophilales bacterium]|nr:ATP-binding protein [Candidatus Gastranaerophilales bacterium]